MISKDGFLPPPLPQLCCKYISFGLPINPSIYLYTTIGESGGLLLLRGIQIHLATCSRGDSVSLSSNGSRLLCDKPMGTIAIEQGQLGLSALASGHTCHERFIELVLHRARCSTSNTFCGSRNVPN